MFLSRPVAVAARDPGHHQRHGRLVRLRRRRTPMSSTATSAGKSLSVPDGDAFEWDEDSTYVRTAAVLRRACRPSPAPIDGHPRRPRAGRARRQRHDRPHLAGRQHQEGLPRRAVPQRARGRVARLQLLRLTSWQPRGDDPRHVRQHPAAQPARTRHRGWRHAAPARRRRGRRSSRRRSAISPTACRWSILAGKEYGSGSSRDWAAKGTMLLGVRAVIAESYERIHRSNLIGMGVLPAAVRRRRVPRVPRPDRRGDLRDRRAGRRRSDPARDHRARPTTRPSPRPSGSTPPARRSTTATAGSCSTYCARCASPDRKGSSWISAFATACTSSPAAREGSDLRLPSCWSARAPGSSCRRDPRSRSTPPSPNSARSQPPGSPPTTPTRRPPSSWPRPHSIAGGGSTAR